MYGIIIGLAFISSFLLARDFTYREILRVGRQDDILAYYHISIKDAVEEEIYYRFILNYYLTYWGISWVPLVNSIINILIILYYICESHSPITIFVRGLETGMLAYYLSTFDGLLYPILIHISYVVFCLVTAQILIAIARTLRDLNS